MNRAMLELQAVIIRLNLISQAPSMRLDAGTRSSDTDIGGNRPSGGIDWQGDREDAYRQKSADYFVRRARRCNTEQQVRALIREAERALYDWQHTPAVVGVELEPGSFYWKCAIADDPGDVKDVARRFSTSAATVYRYRLKYRGLRRIPSAA